MTVSVSIILTHTITGLTIGMVYFLIAVGLSIILGVMNIVNLAHGSFFMLGSYVAFTLINNHLGFWLALVLSVLITTLFGALVERLLLRKVYGNHLEQVLLTFGITIIMVDIVKWVWGTETFMIKSPAILDFTVSLGGGQMIPAYRFFVLASGIVIAFVLWYVDSRTRIGAIIRAGVDDKEMVGALGINVGFVFTLVFAFGAGMASLGGALGGPLFGLYPDLGFEVLVTSLIVVVIGGLGSWKGSFIAAIVIGLIETWGTVLMPSSTMMIVFLLMIAVLMFKPSGLMGRKGVI